MSGEGGQEKPADVLDLLPRELRDKTVEQQLRRLLRELDELVFEDDGEVFVDADPLERLPRDDSVFPRDVRQKVERGIDKHLGRRVRRRGGGRRLKWRDLANRSGVSAGMSAEELRDLEMSPSLSPDAAKRIFTERFADFPSEILNTDGPRLREIAVSGIEHNRTVWDRVVSEIGYWPRLLRSPPSRRLQIVGTATGP